MSAARMLGKLYFAANMRWPASPAHRNGVAVVVGMVVDHNQRVSQNASSFGLEIGVQNC
jgi:hypothetical protein